MGAAEGPLRAPASAAMPVRSVRLPDGLWRRLEALRDGVNQGRADPVNLSSVIRALLEGALTSGRPPDFEARIWRPSRVHRERAARIARTRAMEDAPAVFQKVSELLERHAVTPPAFAKAVGGDRQEAQRFYHSGQLPEQDPEGFLERVRAWIDAVGKGGA